MAVSRETLVEQSVQNFIKDQLFNVRGYSHDAVEILDAFPHKKSPLPQPLRKSYIAMGFHFDEGGQQAELGSDLKTRRYVLEFFVFGQTSVWASNLASTIRDAIDVLGVVPLVDVSQAGNPELDRMIVELATARREPIPDPEPWEENVWSATVQVTDEYHASLV